MNVNFATETIPEVETQSTTKCVNIVDLPDDVLYTVFSFLDIKSLGRVCRACSRLRDVASRDCVWSKISKNFILMSYPGDVISTRSPRQSSTHGRKRRKLLKERCRIAKNWESRNFQDVLFVKHRTKLMPWVKLHRQKLYVSHATNINCYDVFNNGTVREDKDKQLRGRQYDVTRFVVTDDIIVSGFRHGGIIGYELSTNQKKFEYDFNECNDTQAVAVYNDILVAGFRDGSVKVINTSQNAKSGITSLNGMQNNDGVLNRVWSAAISPDGSTFTIGNAGLEPARRTPIEVHDLKSCSLLLKLGAQCKRGAGVLDIKYESPHTFLTCGYDTSLRLWDLRTQTCVQEWTDPFDAALSSLKTDGNNAMVTGTFQHGMTRLWDRRLKNPVQMYYCGQRRSPVYCLDTDFQRLFVALDFGIHMLDFTTYKTPNTSLVHNFLFKQ